MGIRYQVFKEFVRRYATVWRNVWSVRDQLDPPKRDEDERAFLPAHLELTETPLSAAPKWIARLIMLFALFALVWSLIGKMDIVAVAQGKTTPGSRSKTIQPLETAVVKNIAVANGEHVKTGQLLVELSGIGSDSDYTQSSQALQAARLTKLRQEAVLAALEKRQAPVLDKEQAAQWQLPDDDLAAATVLAQNQYQAWQTQDAQLQASLRGHEAEWRSLAAQVRKLEQVGKIESKRTADFKELLAQNFISQHAYYEQESKLIQNQNDLASQRNQMQQVQENIRQAQQNRLLNSQMLQRDTRDALRQADEQIEQLGGQTDKAQQRQQLMTLKSPVNGTVQQLVTHTIGGVVTAAQPIMVVVPDEEQMEIEALLPNKDIGFVKAGQEAVIKIESFPYTRYGYLTGKVKSVSFDAVEHEQLGLVFAVLITLDKNYLMIDGQKVNLTGGMNVTAEIKTGKRRVIDYLLSPLQTKVDESLKER
ncbi:MAG: HlyD family type I secretion periplasmic adaptor subunit [Neisseria sp.]|uniref:HlyD family type I secretion periplasmic adaptor subunit n=1 Tax=Neisseria sp. TaxID=192066 RepID=UPI0026DA8934|nr:HlyD family type I secretion periplasmic adaptor subunit [Neisseria sp.]MDO4249810.1 HlyD family type I secretion periplasmic adaptor subunit [Neisseria sp.]